MPILDHFHLFAPFYDRVIPPADARRLIELLRLPVSGRLLDAGGGTGRVGALLRHLTGGVVIADETFGMLRQAVARGGLLPLRAHTEQLPFASASFDCVLMVDALHHVASQRQTVAELWRVVRPGGRIVIEEPDVRAPAIKVLAVLEKLVLMRSHFLTPPAIAALFPAPPARVQIITEASGAWVLVDKPAVPGP